MTASTRGTSRDARRVKVITQRVRFGAKEFRIIRPAKPLNNGAFCDSGDEYSMYVDRTDGQRIAALWLLAARSPRSLVYLPMRTTPLPRGVDSWHDAFTKRPIDLVLAHHSLQFPPARWKEARRRITAANAHRELQTASVPLGEMHTDEEIDHWDENHRDNRDVMRSRVHAETLFLMGSAKIFREWAQQLLTVAKEGPPATAGSSLYIAGACNYHVCQSIWWPKFDPHNGQYIHVEYCPQWKR